MLESKESKIIVAVVGGTLLAKYLRPIFEEIFCAQCSICGKTLSVTRYFFNSDHDSGWSS